MPTSTIIKSLGALACFLSQTAVAQSGFFPPTASSGTPWNLPKEVYDAAFASPNATGVYDRVVGASLTQPVFTEGRFNLTIAVKDGIPLAQANYTGLDKTKFVTGTRVTFAPQGVSPGGPPLIPQGNLNDTRSVSLCLVWGVRGNEAFPTAGGSAEAGTGKCDADLRDCQNDLQQRIVQGIGSTTRKNETESGCPDFGGLPQSCRDKLGWSATYKISSPRVAMNNTQLLQGGTLLEWASEAHDAGNLTSYREAVRSTFGAFYYFVYHSKDNVTGNRTTSQGGMYPGFMCAKAANITAGSQSGASVLAGGLSYVGMMVVGVAMMMAL